ncbi:MAG: diaminopimelate decarboxylase [Candidatus Fonsibacter sp.]|nr:diaminopimelate decarboxylase [Pelagibacterales bacterium]
MNFLKFKNSKLFFESVNIEKLAKKKKTPFYLYSQQQLKHNFDFFKSTFKKLNPIICFSVKSNSNVKLLSYLKKIGAGADVVSMGELLIALKAKIDPKKIVFSGVGKTDEELNFAIKKNILLINAESESELQNLDSIAKKNKKIVSVGLRINPNIKAKTNKKISTGKKDDKFGMSFEKCLKILDNRSTYSNLNFDALSVHIGSQILEVEPFRKTLSALQKFLDKINKIGVYPNYIDLGGGMGIPYNNERQFNLKQYAMLIESFKNKNNVEIIFEPGRFISGNSGILISKIIYIKSSRNKRFVIIDAAMNDLIRPALYGAKHQILPVTKSKITSKISTEFVGPVCETSDSFITYNKYFKIHEGNFVCITNVGAYGRTLASNYNTRPYSEEILINKNSIQTIKQRQSLKSLIE